MTLVLPGSATLRVPGLSDVEQDALRGLVEKWSKKLPRNVLRARYYDHKMVLRDMGLSIPQRMQNLETVVGWPSKAVDVLSRRVNHDGFVIPGMDAESLGINAILQDNRFDIEAPQAHTSALIHATGFVATSLGDVQSGEPEVLMTCRDAMTGTGFWDERRRAMRQALSIVSVDDNMMPTLMVLYVDNAVMTIERTPGGNWLVDRRTHRASRPLVEPLVYRPRLGRPFGSSRISRSVMSITDAAVRTALRTEVSAEFYSSPQRWAMGADASDFVDADGNPRTGWETILGKVWAIGRDDDGNVPEVGQFTQMTMQPHDDMMRTLATRFAGETNLPVSSLGIVQDNPASAEAIYAAKEELVIEAEATCATFGATWRSAMLTALQLREGWDQVPDDIARLRNKWRDPSTPSKASASQAVVEQVREGILPADSEVTYEQLGYDQTTIARLVADKRRGRVNDRSVALQARAQEALQNPVVAELVGTDGEPG